MKERNEQEAEVNESHQKSQLAAAAENRNTSSRKVAANRRNALKSTGPRTTNGKRRVARNAVRHGFFSKWLLVQHQDGKESQSEYDDFYADIRKHYQPVGWLEVLWAEKIAVSQRERVAGFFFAPKAILRRNNARKASSI